MAFLIPQYEKGEFAIGELAGEVFVVQNAHADSVIWDDDPEVEDGWFCRLCSDGTIATVWTGPFETKQDCMDFIEDEYGLDAGTGEDLEEEAAA